MSEGEVRRRVGGGHRSMTKYGASVEPPRDDAVYYPQDDTHSFFASVSHCLF